MTAVTVFGIPSREELIANAWTFAIFRNVGLVGQIAERGSEMWWPLSISGYSIFDGIQKLDIRRKGGEEVGNHSFPVVNLSVRDILKVRSAGDDVSNSSVL
jgi:hypothetical protein